MEIGRLVLQSRIGRLTFGAPPRPTPESWGRMCQTLRGWDSTSPDPRVLGSDAPDPPKQIGRFADKLSRDRNLSRSQPPGSDTFLSLPINRSDWLARCANRTRAITRTGVKQILPGRVSDGRDSIGQFLAPTHFWHARWDKNNRHYVKSCRSLGGQRHRGDGSRPQGRPEGRIGKADGVLPEDLSEMVQQSVYQAFIDQSPVISNTVYNAASAPWPTAYPKGTRGQRMPHLLRPRSGVIQIHPT
uniref:Uncharacterized protein n=1 Tax=Setaria viridis TaxID=4556 RepID=A0A4U6WC46_SETVI|nr:hypothetical protein SEVIR_1G236800v2 [Setaria viridis]